MLNEDNRKQAHDPVAYHMIGLYAILNVTKTFSYGKGSETDALQN